MTVENVREMNAGGMKAEFDLVHDNLILKRCHLFQSKGKPKIGFTQFDRGLSAGPARFQDAVDFTSKAAYRKYQQHALSALARDPVGAMVIEKHFGTAVLRELGGVSW